MYRDQPPAFVEFDIIVIIKGEKVYWRRNKFKSKASLYLENGEIAASAVISGLQAEAPLG